MRYSESLPVVSLVVAATLLASCSVVRTMQQQDRARHTLLDAYAGKPVDRITFLLTAGPGGGAISENQLVTWTDFTQAHAYLITVGKGCPDLYLAGSVRLTSTGDLVRADSDHVIAAGFICPIRTIQPVDYLRVQRELGRQQVGQNALPNAVTVRD